MLESPLRSFLDKRLRHGYALRKRRRRHAKKRARCFLCLFLLLLLLSGCGSKVPEVIKNPNTEFVTLEAYGEKDYVVPENYEHIIDNIYAVVKNGLIVEYKKIVLQSGQYVWLDCEAEEIMK